MSKKQTTFCYCPGCNKELCAQPDAFVSDTDLVRYRCACGHESSWDFDAPAPLLISPTPPQGQRNTRSEDKFPSDWEDKLAAATSLYVETVCQVDAGNIHKALCAKDYRSGWIEGHESGVSWERSRQSGDAERVAGALAMVPDAVAIAKQQYYQGRVDALREAFVFRRGEGRPEQQRPWQQLLREAEEALASASKEKA